MTKRIRQGVFTAALTGMAWIASLHVPAETLESPSVAASESPSSAIDATPLDRLVGQAVEISAWAHAWRADRAVQATPEAYFIPRRLERLDRIYRTASSVLPPDQLKSIHYQMPDILATFPPKPKGPLLAGLLWTGLLAEYRVVLEWPGEAAEIPSPEAVEVRVYPTSYGWFGWTVDRVLERPEVSPDRRTWTYASGPPAKMDWAYSLQVDAATEMVAVFGDLGKTRDGTRPIVPELRVIAEGRGPWTRMDVEIEWGFEADTEKADFDGRVECDLGRLGAVAPLAEDGGTSIEGTQAWRSRAVGGARRGIVLPILFSPKGSPALDTRVSIWTKAGGNGVSYRVRDLERGPILIPGHGIFIAKVGSGKTAREFAAELEARNLKSLRQMTREHREAASWEEVLREVRLSTCPPGTGLAPFPPVEDPPMQVQLPDPGWTAAWRAASNQLKGRHMWGGLAFEVGRVAHEMDLVGLHAEADKVYQHFLASPGVKPDGDYADGTGALEWAKDLRHDMGYNHDGTHASTGRLLFAMSERYFLTGDREWLERNRARLEAAADWIIRQRMLFLKDVPNREALLVAGLMPPCMLGDYAMPSCDWHWYWVDQALALEGLQRFAEALRDLDPAAGKKYLEEAEAFRRDIRRAVDRDAALAPVRLGRDGKYHSFLPRMAYAQGLTGPELGAPQFPECDLFMGSLPLAEPFAALDARDARMVDTLGVMEEFGTSPERVAEREAAWKLRGLSAGDAWFWHPFVILPKASHNANIYLLQDDVPNFLRFWMNAYAAMVGADGRLWEHWHLGSFDVCSAPDNGTAGWFLENFRNLLVMEEGRDLWLARATPRAWLEEGKTISVKDAPTHFGHLAYEIVSEVDQGKIRATIEIPSRNPPEKLFVRFRHPRSVPIREARVDGQPWTDIHPGREFIELEGRTGTVVVEALY